MPDCDEHVAARIFEMAAIQGGLDVTAVSMQSRLEEDLGYDSLDKIEFAMQIEEAFGVEIPDEEAEKVQTVEDAVALVSRSAGARSVK